MNGDEVGLVGQVGQLQAQLLRLPLQVLQSAGDALGVQVGHQAADGQRKAAAHGLSLREDQAAARFAQAPQRRDDGPVVHAGGHEVVRVVGHGRGDGAALHPESRDEADGKASRAVVALHHDDLGEVAGRVGDGVPLRHERGHLQRSGDDLARPHLDDVHRLALGRNAELLLGEGRRLRRMGQRDGVCLRALDRDAVLDDDTSVLPDVLHVEARQVIDQHEVRSASGRDGPPIPQVEVVRRRERRQAKGHEGVHALLDHDAQLGVHVPRVPDVARRGVVRHDHAARGQERVLLQQGEERPQVGEGGALAHHHPHAAPQLLPRLIEVHALVVRRDARGEVGVQVLSRNARRVARQDDVARRRHLAPHVRVSLDERRVVHHLPQVGAPPLLKHLPNGHHVQLIPGRFKSGCRDAGGRAQEDVDGQSAARQVHVADAGKPQGVRYLVGVRHDGGRPVDHHGVREGRRRHQAAFDVDVPVDQAGDQDGPRRIQDTVPLVAPADARDPVPADGDVGLLVLHGKDVRDAGPPDHEVRRLAAPGDCGQCVH